MGVVETTGAVQVMSVVGAVAVRDPGSTRIVYAVIAALALLGVGLAVFAWWLARTTRPDPEVLAPLEAIDSRQWRRLDPAGRRRLLDELRPDGAEPTNPEPLAPEPDDEFTEAPAASDVRELADEPATTDDADVRDAGAGDGADQADEDDPGDDDTGDDDSADDGPGAEGSEWDRWDESLGLRAPDGERSTSMPPPNLP